MAKNVKRKRYNFFNCLFINKVIFPFPFLETGRKKERERCCLKRRCVGVFCLNYESLFSGSLRDFDGWQKGKVLRKCSIVAVLVIWMERNQKYVEGSS